MNIKPLPTWKKSRNLVQYIKYDLNGILPYKLTGRVTLLKQNLCLQSIIIKHHALLWHPIPIVAYPVTDLYLGMRGDDLSCAESEI